MYATVVGVVPRDSANSARGQPRGLCAATEGAVRPTVGVDLDGVVADFVSAALSLWKREGIIACTYHHDDWTAWLPQQCLPVTPADQPGSDHTAACSLGLPLPS